MTTPRLMDLDFDGLAQLIAGLGFPAFRAKQVWDWLAKGVAPQQMKNLPAPLRDALVQQTHFGGAVIRQQFTSQIDGTVKTLFALEDGHIVEGVLMRHPHGNTLCISSQVGCRMGCTFCASTLEGLARNLTDGEMLSQVLLIDRQGREGSADRFVTNIVIMGSGEPLDNYEHVLRFLRRVSDEKGLNISPRNITLSTCGLVPGIRRLTQEGLHVNLALSLHAPNDALRKQLIPASAAYPLAQVMQAVMEYYQVTGRRITLEYAMIRGVNDSIELAKQLAALIENRAAVHVNLIPLNAVAERNLHPSDQAGLRAFEQYLSSQHINITRRRAMGSDIQGACGQLRRAYIKGQEEQQAPEGGDVHA